MVIVLKFAEGARRWNPLVGRLGSTEPIAKPTLKVGFAILF